jgi:hypothetical protein
MPQYKEYRIPTTVCLDGPINRPLILHQVLKSTEANILTASTELKEIVVESGHMAESLFERVNDGYKDLTVIFQGEGAMGLSRYRTSLKQLKILTRSKFNLKLSHVH